MTLPAIINDNADYSEEPQVRSRRRLWAFIALLLVFGIVAPLTYSIVFANATLTYPQCGDGKTSPLTCNWQNGEIGISTDTYYEGMAVPQQAIFGNLPDPPTYAGPVYTFTTWISAVAGNDHGYDFSVSVDQAIALNKYYAGDDYVFSYCKSTDTPCLAAYNGGYHITATFPMDTFKSGTRTTLIASTYYSAHQKALMDQFGFGLLYADFYANAPISSAYISVTHTATEGSDVPIADETDTCGSNCQSWIKYTFVFTTTASNVGIWYAPHLALGGNSLLDPIAWGPHLGAGEIGGSAWHVKDMELNERGGSQDNQIKVGAGTTYPFSTLSTQPATYSQGGNHVYATDAVTIPQSTTAHGDVEGTAAFYMCKDVTVPFSPTTSSGLDNGCISSMPGVHTSPTNGYTYTTEFVNTATVVRSCKSGSNYTCGTVTSPQYEVKQPGYYCWLIVFTPTVESNGLMNYPPISDTDSGNGSECFIINSPTAVKLSSFDARASTDSLPGGFSVPLLLFGLLGIVTSTAVWWFGFRRS